MKNRLFIFSMAALFALAAVSCQDPVVPPKPQPPVPSDPLKVTAVGNMGKYALSQGGFASWGANDNFAIFWKRDEGFSASTRYDIVGASIDNEAGQAGFSGDLYWDTSKQQQFFYAIAPCPAGELSDPQSVPVSLPAVQTQTGRTSDHLGTANVMIARPVAAVAPDFTDPGSEYAPVKLDFAPLFSMLEVRLIAYHTEEITIQSMKIESVTPETVPFTLDGASVDVTVPGFGSGFGKITGGTPGYSVQLDFPGNETLSVTDNGYITSDPTRPAGEEFLPAHLMLLPGNYSGGGALRFTFETSAGQVVTERSAFSIAAGQKRIMTLVVPATPLGNASGAIWTGTRATEPASINTETKEIDIVTPEQLAWLADVVNKEQTFEGLDPRLCGYTVNLLADMNLNNLPWTPIGNLKNDNWTNLVANEFCGKFNGNGFTIYNMYVSNKVDGEFVAPTANSCYGLFGNLRVNNGAGSTTGANPVEINDLKVTGTIEIVNPGTTAPAFFVGGVAGRMQAPSAIRGVIKNCHFEGEIKIESNHSGSSRYGGLVGDSAYTLTDGCTVRGEISTISNNVTSVYLGGINGYANNGVAVNCANYANIDVTGNSYIGGISSYNGDYYGCLNAGNITIAPYTGTGTGYVAVGGIVGYYSNNKTLTACYNTGNITIVPGKGSASNYDSVGGIVGLMSNVATEAAATGTAPATRVTGCYNLGTITATDGNFAVHKGNIAGWAGTQATQTTFSYYNVANCYYLGEPLPNDNGTNAGLDGKTFRFSETNWPVSTQTGWGTGEGAGVDTSDYWKDPLPGYNTTNYPRLWWE